MVRFYENLHSLLVRLSKLNGYCEASTDELFQLLGSYKAMLRQLKTIDEAQLHFLNRIVTKAEPVVASLTFAHLSFRQQKKNYQRSRNLLRLALHKTARFHNQRMMRNVLKRAS